MIYGKEKKHLKSFGNSSAFRATDGVRTRDPNLGKVVLYQLSHCRIQIVQRTTKL